MNSKFFTNTVARGIAQILPALCVVMSYIYSTDFYILDIISLLKTLLLVALFLYINFASVTIINLLFMRLFKKKIHYFTLFPFSYDGKVRFVPKQLSLNQEAVLSPIPFNLNNYGDLKDYELLNHQYKQNLQIWCFSEFLSIALLWIVIYSSFHINTAIFLVIFVLLKLSYQLFGYEKTSVHVGYFFVYFNNLIDVYILYKMRTKETTFTMYEYFFHTIYPQKRIAKATLYQIILNYLYFCIYSNASPLKGGELMALLHSDQIPGSEECAILRINDIKILGVSGKMLYSSDYIENARNELIFILNSVNQVDTGGLVFMQNIIFSKIDEILKFFDGIQNQLNPSHLILNVTSIYSFGQDVEDNIILYCTEMKS